MSSFALSNPNLESEGPCLEIHIALNDAAETARRTAGLAAMPPKRILGLIDTGARATVIQKGLASQLGVTPTGVTRISTASCAAVRCLRYPVRLWFPNHVYWDGTVIEAPLQGQTIQCLIGRDILARGVFIYSGFTKSFTLSF